MRYESLTRYLQGRREAVIRLSFQDIEALIGRPLPPSARRHQAWWANTATHSHADAWLRIGWRTRDLDLAGQRIVFQHDDPAKTVGVAEGVAEFRRDAPDPTMIDPVTFDRAKLNIAARRILDDYTGRFGGDVQRALDVALEEARIAAVERLLDGIPHAEPGPDSIVDMIREDRDAR